jgi:Gram-negative bacterial TonB protein C-terminal
VTEVAQLEVPVQGSLHDTPKLLVEWSPRWQEFVTSIRPAFARTTARLAGETPFGIRPYRNMFSVMAVEAFLMFAFIVIRMKIEELRPYLPPQVPGHDVIYYSGDELPRTEDLDGSQSGASGQAGGQQSHHRTQTIRVVRGGSLAPKIVDAPNLKIPNSRDAVANLLAVRPDAGPPPLEGLRSAKNALTLPTTVVAPAPGVLRDYTRNAILPSSVIPPVPEVSRESQRTSPSLNSTIVAPAPEVARDHLLVAPLLSPNVVAPAPDVRHEHARSSPAISASVIPPAPDANGGESARTPVQMANNVVPPPLSAPERESARTSRVSLPPPSVVAPPPSDDISHDMRRLGGSSAPDPSKAVVPPPPSATGGSSLVSSLLGKLFGPSDVVPPPPPAPANSQNGGRSSLAPNVVAPPPASNAGSDLRGSRGAPAMSSKVVPPPPSIASPGTPGGHGNGTQLASNVVPPPPSVASDTSSGSGRGAKGGGLGRALDIGSPVAPPASGGAGTGPAAIISTQPGPKVGKPNDTTAGSLAMSPTGADKSGIGGSGGGKGIGRGPGPGAGMTGTNSGAGTTGTGHGSAPNAHSGISPSNGPGGAGNAASGNPPVPGVSVTGGSSVVTLPSFGDDSGGGGAVAPAHSSARQPSRALDITVVATSTSGGAFEAYRHWLPGGEVYTRYLDTSLGSVVLEFADPAPSSHPHTNALVGPQPIRLDLPQNLPHARFVVACVLDASGNLKNFRVLEAGPAAMDAKVLAALESWKFQPVMIADQPIEVSAILGFNIDTNDRYQ